MSKKKAKVSSAAQSDAPAQPANTIDFSASNVNPQSFFSFSLKTITKNEHCKRCGSTATIHGYESKAYEKVLNGVVHYYQPGWCPDCGQERVVHMYTEKKVVCR